MAGRKYGVVVYARTPASYAGLSAAEKAKPGRALEQVFKKYAGKVEMVRRYWTGAFSHESSDVFIIEGDDPETIHAFNEDLNAAFAKLGGDPGRFGNTVRVSFGINPDAEAPKRRRR